VYVWIVDIEATASRGYPKTKLHAEAVLVNSELPSTILRTQFVRKAPLTAANREPAGDGHGCVFVHGNPAMGDRNTDIELAANRRERDRSINVGRDRS
jgi:hypothetical protein